MFTAKTGGGNTTKKKEKKTATLKRLKNYALWLLARQGYTEKELRRKLSTTYPDGTAFNNEVIEYCQHYDYINDKKFAEAYVRSLLSQKMGINKIKQKMYTKGFSADDITEAISGDEVLAHDFFTQALALKQRRYGDAPLKEPKLKQKALNYLIRKGFDFSLILGVLSYNPLSEEDEID
jgi:regulatory protein